MAEGPESGHLILDDEFWLKYVNSNGERATLLSSEYSCKYQEDKGLKSGNLLRPLKTFVNKKIPSRLAAILKVLFTPRIKRSVVIVQGFEEVSFLVFLFKHFFAGNKYVLVLTNNISSKRLDKGGVFLKMMLKLIFSKVDVILYHTSFELLLLKSFVSEKIWNKFEYVKYHLMSKNDHIKPTHSKIISYYGPVKYDKPIEPLLKLIHADTQNQFHYFIHNPGAEMEKLLIEQFKERPNVQINTKFITYEEYLTTVNNSAFIFLSHNKFYEGKLSGNLCDCVSNTIPYISDKVSPIDEFETQYGQMGYVYDFIGDEDWSKKFLSDYNINEHNEFIINMYKMLEDYSFESLRNELNSIFARFKNN